MKTNHKGFLAGRSGRAALAVFAMIAVCFGLMRTALADTLLFEGFEGNFPQDNGWTVGDANATGTPAYWEDVPSTGFGTVTAHTANWKGYCAGIGYAGTTAAPLYQPYMDAYMQKTLDLRSVCSPSLSFWYRTPSIEPLGGGGQNYDYLLVKVGGTIVFSNGIANAAWVNVVVDLSAWTGTQPTLGFTFHSDFSNQYEGVYLDDILVTATPALATIWPVVSWGTQQDTDGDGCLTAPADTFRLIWDPDVSCGGGTTLSVFEKIYRRPCGSGTWTLYYTTADHIITGTSGGDQQYLDIPASSGCACYDYRIDVYRSGQVAPDFIRDPTSNPILGGHREELLSEETATIFSAYFSNQVDRDGDGCWAAPNDSFRLVYDVDVVGGSGILNVFEKVYYRLCGAGSWILYTTTPNHSITNAYGSDAVYVDIVAGYGCSCYDYRIETYRVGQVVPDFTMDSSHNYNLANHREEYSSQDWPTVDIFDAWWGTQQDTDGDGCMTAPNDTFRLYWDPDVTNCAATMMVYEKVYSRPTGSATWTLYTTTASHWITNCFGADSMYVDLPAHSACAAYDYKIELYRLDHSAPDFVADASNFPVLGSHREELLSEEKATIFGAYWYYQQDHDGDGCWASTNNYFRLVYDPDVVGCSGTLTVFEKVYYQQCGASTWTLYTTTANHVINGCAIDANYVDIVADPGCACYNYKIEVYRAGQTVPDFTLGPDNDAPVLANHLEELYLEDECSLSTATIYDAWWTYQVDNDNNGCWEPLDANNSFRLNWDPDVVGCDGSISVFEKVYWRTCGGSTNWTLWTTTTPHSITGTSIADEQYIDIPTGVACSCWDYKIEIYRAGQTTPDYTRDSSNDADLGNHREEEQSRPPLAIAKAGTNVVLSWPTNFTGFALQSASALPPPPVTWGPVAPPPVIVGNQWTVTNAIAPTKTFYRLIK